MEPAVLRVASSLPGYLVTEWLPIPGKEAGLGGFRKRWFTEVRYHLRITPLYGEAQKCVLLLMPEVRERPNDAYAWMTGAAELAATETALVFGVVGSSTPTEAPTNEAP